MKKILSIILCMALFFTMLSLNITANAKTITVFSQTDSRWGGHYYGYSNTAGTQRATISSGGCGILSMVNAVYYLNGSFIEPITLADYSVNNGYRVNGTGTSLGLYKSFCNNRGAQYNIEYAGSTSSYSTLAAHLKSGGVAVGSAPNHLMAVVDYDTSNGKFLILDSSRRKERYTLDTGYTWQTESTMRNSYYLNFSCFEMIRSTVGPIVEPMTVDSSYSRFMPLTAYLATGSTVSVYESNLSSTAGEILTTDKCSINEIYTNGWCKVTYPVGNTTKTKYTQLSNFMPDRSKGLTQKSAQTGGNAYARADGSTNIGSVSKGDVCYFVGQSGDKVQVIYPTSSGFKLGYVSSSIFRDPPPVDERFNPYCPIKGYLLNNSTVKVYDFDFSTQTGGEIWGTDYFTIDAVYSNGWCQVTYPTASGNKTACTQLSNIVYDTSATPVQYTANSQINVYTRSDMSSTPNWWISSGDKFFKISSTGNSTQVMYPVDAQYGGGYKIGWIYTSQLPVTTYSVTYNANGGSGAPEKQTKRYDEALKLSETIPIKEGYTFLGWSESSAATSVDFAAGVQYTENANLNLYAVWIPKKYSLTYDCNGGYANISDAYCANGEAVSITSVIPEKSYVIYFSDNKSDGEDSSKSVGCRFLGWNTVKNSPTVMYKASDKITLTKDTTLYAVWSNPVVGQLEAPIQEGYSFKGWYTAEKNGTLVTSTAVVNDDMVVYAVWEKKNADVNAPNFTVSNATGKAGENVTVDISISNNPGITSFKVDLSYPSELTLTGVEYPTLFSSKATGKNKLESPFTISWFSSLSEDETANGFVARLTFKISDDANKGTYPITLSYDEENVFNIEFENKYFETEDGFVEVISYIPGDVNADKSVNMKDIVLLQQYLNGWNVTIDEKAANVNGDTSVNMKDIALLQQYLNGWNVVLK